MAASAQPWNELKNLLGVSLIQTPSSKRLLASVAYLPRWRSNNRDLAIYLD
jgi:hypothetical protein